MLGIFYYMLIKSFVIVFLKCKPGRYKRPDVNYTLISL